MDTEETPISMLILPEGGRLSKLKELLDQYLADGHDAVIMQDTIVYVANYINYKPEEVN